MNHSYKECKVFIDGEEVTGLKRVETSGETGPQLVARVAKSMGLDPAKVLLDTSQAQKLNDKTVRAAIFQSQRNEQTPNRKARRAARVR